MLNGLPLDTHAVWRSLRRSPGFALTVLTMLAGGIAITTAVMSIADHILVRGLPFKDSGRLMLVLERDEHGALRGPSGPTSIDWARDPQVAQAFDGVSFVPGSGATIRAGNDSVQSAVAYVDSAFFPIVAVRPRLGRLLVAGDHRPGAPAAAVISDHLWHKLGADPSILGRTIVIDRASATVVGVLPTGANYPLFADVWLSVRDDPHPDVLAHRGQHSDSRTIARLRPGVDSARAMRLMRTVGERLASSYPAEQKGWMPAMFPVQLEIIGNVKPTLLILVGAASVILLLICANVAGLSLARGTTRTRELALRRALGASAGRIVRQLFTESLALSVVGGVAGTLLAMWAVRTTARVAGARLPRVDELTIDWRVLAVAAAVTMLTSLLCGLWPSVRATRTDAMEVLRASAAGSVGIRSDVRLRRVLVALQFGLSFALLAAAGLLLQSFRRASEVKVGFEPKGVYTLRVFPPPGAYSTADESAALFRRLMDAARAVPGVTHAAFINHAPFHPASVYTTVSIPGRTALDSSNQIFYRTVSASYLETMGMSMKAGRWFTDEDERSPGGGFVINETTARMYWPSGRAVGQRMTVTRASQARPNFGQPMTATVIGVVADIHQQSQDVVPVPEVYVPYTLEPWAWGNLIVRTTGGSGVLAGLASAVHGVDPRLVPAGRAGADAFDPMSGAIAFQLKPRETTVFVVGLFAAIALALAAVGMYGVVSYSIGQRTTEIGIRKALGATGRDVAGLVIRDMSLVLAAAAVLGGAGGYVFARLLRTQLFETGALDPVTYAVALAVLVLASACATAMPARAAARVDPIKAMRWE